jgi:DNA-binding NtrC family response regulator
VGGVDYIPKPFQKEELLIRVENHLKISRLTQELLKKNRELEDEISRREEAERERKQAEDARVEAFNALERADEQLSMISQQEAARWGIAAFVGKSKTIRQILDDIRQLQAASKTSVLITGESGTGKELVARAIHFGGERAKEAFLPVNCSAIPEELAESTLFGHVRGAFSGAHTSHKGYFELADGGTLFLDEISDMPMQLQAKLLRVIEDGSVMPVGGTRGRYVDVRILAATNRDLRERIAQGAFREDLYFRLARSMVTVPPLRERNKDIPLLTEHFTSIFATEMGLEKPTLSAEAMEALINYRFPGNVRELKNIIEHALIKSHSPIIELKHLDLVESRDLTIHRTATTSGENASDASVSDIESTPALAADAEKVMTYVQEHGSISNSECRELLSVDRHRANYILQRMCDHDLLIRRGELRWSRYYLP